MELYYLRPGHRIRTRDGAEAEVLSETEDGQWIRVRYLDGADDPLFGGTEDLAHKDEVEALLGVVHKSTWGEEVTVVLHHVPESAESEGEYEATIMKGIPHGVSITGSDPDSKEGALNFGPTRWRSSSTTTRQSAGARGAYGRRRDGVPRPPRCKVTVPLMPPEDP